MDFDAFSARLVRHASAGESLFRAGEPGRHLYVVKSGLVEIRQPATDGSTDAPLLLRRVGPGEIFGEIALIEEVPRTADAVAACDSELLEIDHAHFVYLAGQQPAFAVMMMKLLSQKLRGAEHGDDADVAAVPRSGAPGQRASAWQRLADNVYSLGGEPGGGGCKVYLVRGTRRNVLIDAGLPHDYPFIEAHLGALGLEPGDIDMILVTHEHLDHLGGVARFPRRTLVAAHPRAANKIAMQDDFVLMNDLFGLAPAAFHVDVEIEDGSRIDLGGTALHAVHTPGHVSGALCFYEPERQLLFTADTLFAGGTLGGIYASGNNSDYAASLRRLSALRIRHLFPGHGRNSDTPLEDCEAGIRALERLQADTRALFDAMQHGSSFRYVFRGIAAYSLRKPKPPQQP